MLSFNEANALIGSTITCWDEDSASYQEGVLEAVNQDSDECEIRLPSRTITVAMINVHAGTVDEVDAAFMAPMPGFDPDTDFGQSDQSGVSGEDDFGSMDPEDY